MAPTDIASDPNSILPPALPEPVKDESIAIRHDDEDAVATAVDHAAAALAVVGGLEDHQMDHHPEDHQAAVSPEQDGGVDPDAPPEMIKTPKKRNKKLPLTFHEALTFASRGVYVDIETGQLRCSCNHKPSDKWDAYGYTRHFAFKCHKKYESERLDDGEIARLREAKETFMRMNPIVEESSIRKKRKMKEGEKVLSVDELRVQERHWMEMWKDAKNELKQLRQDLKDEADEEVRAELFADVEGLKKRKGDWARLLGLNDASTDSIKV
eukprot:CAMPEP_0181098876 /NCGR_PEP_ID=MMETSP1071-20121207/12362_1 /TAXON_ID=35127 /ORGANISM="Thalassiosira sp., Strain NH16" /LENGTH=267 /DNA_ID=CAMNT_0023181505 /DNA_START=40 /DNA_END=843 /DNA_ORIENTATION=-